MDERRPEPPAADLSRTAGLSPIQQVWADYRLHTRRCPDCRTMDGGRCDKALVLWRRHRELCDEAYTALAAERGRVVP